MALDYLQELKKFSDGGGTDIGAFLKQHTAATQTTPGPSVPKPVSDITPPPTPPNPVVAPPAPVTSGQNVVRAAMAPPPPAATGAVAQLPARNPIASRNLEPPLADQTRILGQARPTTPITVPPVKPQQTRSVTPPTFPVLGTAPEQPAVTQPRNDELGATDKFGTLLQFGQSTGLGAKDKAGNLLQGDEAKAAGDKSRTIPRNSFRLPSETKSGRDFLTGNKLAENDSPPGAAPYSSGPLANPKPTPKPTNLAAATVLPRRRNQRAVVNPTVPRIFSGAV